MQRILKGVLGHLFLLSGLALSAQNATAQNPPPHPLPPMPANNIMEPHPPMPPAEMRAAPEHIGVPAEMLLNQREELDLTADQVKRLEALAKTQRESLRPPRSQMLRAQADLADAEERDNIDAQRAALE